MTGQLGFAFDADDDVHGGRSCLPIDTEFPESAANELSALESYNKHLWRPNTYLHKWWARRSGSTFRFILKQLVTDGRRDFYSPGGLEGRIVLDPMMGGGTTVHEAVRMGANVIGVDIDPIPVLQARASLTALPLPEKQMVFDQFLQSLRSVLMPLFTAECPYCSHFGEVQFVLYGLAKRCLCREIILLDSLAIREGDGRTVRICPICHEVYLTDAHECSRPARTVELKVKGTRTCGKCGGFFHDDPELGYADRYRPLVVVGKCASHGQFFREVGEADLLLLQRASDIAARFDLGVAPDLEVPDGPKSHDLRNHGVQRYDQVFSARQRVYLGAALQVLKTIPAEHRLWLGLLISTSLEFNALLCGYKGGDARGPGAIRHVFSHHAYSFPYTALENNPVFSGGTSGTLNRLFMDRIVRAGRWAQEPEETKITGGRVSKVKVVGERDQGEAAEDWAALREGSRRFLVCQADSSALQVPAGMVDFVVTDPPYYDSVQYSDLAGFFRVWLRRFLPHDVDWDYDPLASAVSEGDDFGNRKYGEVLGRIWAACHTALSKHHGRLVFTFHHWRPEAWAELTLSLRRAKFVLVNRFVVFSENPISVHIRQLNALKHDTILVLAPEEAGAFGTWSQPMRIDSRDSYQFCMDCGAAVGWFLASSLTDAEIRSGWRLLLSENGHDETP